MPALHHAYRNFGSAIEGKPVVGGGRYILGPAFKGCPVGMKKRRSRKHQARSKSMDPGEVSENVLLSLAVAHAIGLVVRTVGHLEVVLARCAHKAELILGVDVKNQ